MPKTTRIAFTMIVAALATGCPQQVRQPDAPTALPPNPAADTRGATLYTVDPAASRVHILVYRGGSLARLGHNHVLTAQHLHGRAWLHREFGKSGFEVAFPVNDLIVDDPQARHQAGGEFPPEIPAADRDGTRRNLLRPEVLDGERFPEITLRSVQMSGSLVAPRVRARVTIRDISRDIDVPLVITRTEAQVTASGELELKQTDFGITPFSIALGALEVQDRLRIRFVVVARTKT